jgi:hypothetical protein
MAKWERPFSLKPSTSLGNTVANGNRIGASGIRMATRSSRFLQGFNSQQINRNSKPPSGKCRWAVFVSRRRPVRSAGMGEQNWEDWKTWGTGKNGSFQGFIGSLCPPRRAGCDLQQLARRGFSFSLEIGDPKLYADRNVPPIKWLLSERPEQLREAKVAHALKRAPLSQALYPRLLNL